MSVKWYHTNFAPKVATCSFCTSDDQFSLVSTTEYIIKTKNNITCRFCKWCPEKDGTDRPVSKTSPYKYKVDLFNELYGIMPPLK